MLIFSKSLQNHINGFTELSYVLNYKKILKVSDFASGKIMHVRGESMFTKIGLLY